jgi:hypothetical protein
LHKQRNVLNAIPRRVRQHVEAELVGIWAQPTKQADFLSQFWSKEVIKFIKEF